MLIIGGLAVGAGLLFFRDSGLKAGDCFDPPPDVRGAYAEFSAVSCANPHRAEIYFATTYADGPYDESGLNDFVVDRCPTEFNAYTGRDFETDPDLDAGAWYPSEDEWTAGNHRVLCYAVRIDGSQLTGTVRAP